MPSFEPKNTEKMQKELAEMAYINSLLLNIQSKE